jgi:hypothetical protein
MLFIFAWLQWWSSTNLFFKRFWEFILISAASDSDSSLVSTISTRLLRVNTEPGYGQILEPKVYAERGRLLLQSNKDAANANPRVDKVYDDWSVRYEREFRAFEQGGPIPSLTITKNPEDTISILEHPDIGLNARKEWSYAGYISKGEKHFAETSDPERAPNYVATVFVDKESGALMATDCDSSVDTYFSKDGEPEPPRVFNSKLLYQTWRDEIDRSTSDIPQRVISDLRFIVKFPIVNEGTRITIKDAYKAKDIDTATKTTFTASDTSYEGILGDCWSGITGTVSRVLEFTSCHTLLGALELTAQRCF